MWKLQENILEAGDKKYLVEFINSTDRFTQFEKVKAFEADWSKWQNCNYSTFVNSGSSADLIMLDAVKEFYDIEDNAEVLVPAVTWTTNITSVVQAKMKPVFVDINLKDFSFDYEKLEQAITPKTKIILVTHLIGLPADMSRIAEIALKHNLIVLEDCCESHGATFEGRKIGNFGVASTFSFYWGHHLTTVEGGMICTENEDLNDLFILKRSHGLARELHPSKHERYRLKYPHMDFNFLFLTQGYNFRNTELHAVLGIEQLKHLDKYILIRNRNHKQLLDITRPIQDKLYEVDNKGISSFCLPFIFKNKKDKDVLREALSGHIENRPIVSGNLLLQPCFTQYGDYRKFTNAQIAHENGFYIGNNQFVNEERLHDLDLIIKKSIWLLIPETEYEYIKEHIPIACVDLLIIHEKKCLLLLRDNEPAKGQYWFPGGRISKNETIRHAAIRKAQEETNLDCEFEKIISVEETFFENNEPDQTGVHTINICCLLTVKQPSSVLVDKFHTNFKWISSISNDLHTGVKNPLELMGFKII